MNITVTINKVLFPKERTTSTFWAILLTDHGKCTGNLPFWPEAGMKLSLVGEEAVWNGQRQFKFRSVDVQRPEDERSFLEYVCHITKGTGPATAKKIYEQFGDSWQSHYEEFPERVRDAIVRTLHTLHSNEERLNLLKSLIALGLSDRTADLCAEKWGANAAAVIAANPYSLCELPGIGFKTADKAICKRYCIAIDDPRRARAAVSFELMQFMQGGSSLIFRYLITDAVIADGIPAELAAETITAMAANHELRYFDMDGITTPAVMETELGIAEYLVNSEPAEAKSLSRASYEDLDDGQFAAVANADNRGVMALSGGAGVGKTTVIDRMADRLTISGWRVHLCAFAGKAAARLREVTGRKATTIHALLGYRGEKAGFHPMRFGDNDAIIVDEASMVPSSLLWEIIKRNPGRLILVGDDAQLPPVGIGSPFLDIIENMPQFCMQLDYCYRSNAAVYEAGAAVRRGDYPKSGNYGGERFEIIELKDEREIHERIIAEARSIDFSKDIIIAPKNGEKDDLATVNAINAAIKAIVNPANGISAGDRVICTKNMATHDLWNGTLGWVDAVDTDGRILFRSDDDQQELLNTDERDNIALAYCITVHKAQGSQYRRVLIACAHRDFAMFDRSMLYTAITRARNTCEIYTDGNIGQIVGRRIARQTVLASILKGAE